MSLIEQRLRKYALDNKCVNDAFYTALSLLSTMDLKAYQNKEYRSIFVKWINYGGTINLKNALAGISYDENNLTHFNAMTLLDTVSLIK